jgi:hypothetical protein
MSDQYNFVWSDPTAKPGFTVLPQTTDTTDSPLTLVGRGSPNWGQGLQQNMLFMIEHFASPTPPAAPNTTGQIWYDMTTQSLFVYDSSMVDAPSGPWLPAGGGSVAQATAPTNTQIGDLWYDTANGTLNVWSGSAWNQVYPNLSIVPVAWVQEYNNMAVLINQIIGTPTGTTLATAFGWNQTNLIAPVTAATLTNANWISMLNQITQICNFLGISTSGISTQGFIYQTGNTIPYGIVTMLQQYTSTLATVTGLSAGTVRFKPQASSLESTTPATGTQTRTTAWENTITHTVTVQFANSATMYAYFNAGGQIQFIPTLTGPLTGRDYDYQAFLMARGTVAFSVTGTVDSSAQSNTAGLYNLTTSVAQIFGVLGSASDAYGQPKYVINANLVNGYTIQFAIQYTDTGTLYNGVGGTLTSKTTLVRPAAAQLSSPVIAWPTVTQSASIS